MLALSVLLIAAALGGPAISPQPKARQSGGGGGGQERPVVVTNLTLTVYNATHVRYLRTGVFTRYEGGRWVPGGGNLTGPERPRIPAVRVLDRVTVRLNFKMNGTIPLPLNTLDVEGVNYTRDNETWLFRSRGPFSEYSFTAVTYLYNYSYLLNLTPVRNEAYTSIPSDVLPAVLGFLMSFNGSSLSYYQVILYADLYLLQNRRVVEKPRYPPNVNELVYFLQNATEGSPYDFASAVVFIARAVGVPARLVEGYRITPYPAEQVLNASKKTYWVELYFNQTGWITFDPLNPFGNVYVPLRVRPVPPGLNLTPGSGASVSFHLLDVVKKPGLKVESPVAVVDEVYFSRYSVNVNLSAPRERGAFPVVLTNGTVPYAVSWLVTWDGFRDFPKEPIKAYPGGSTGRYLVVLRGEVRNLTFEHSDWVKVLSANFVGNNETEVWFSVTPPLGARGGLAFQWIEFKSRNWSAYFYFPVMVYEPVRVDITEGPTEVLAGRPFHVAGNVTMAIPDEPVNGGTVAVVVPRRNWRLLGVGPVVNGTFNVTALFPKAEEPGLRDVKVLYYPPNFSATCLLPGVAPLGGVYIVQVTRFEVNRTQIVRDGPFVLTGRLVDSAGRGVPDKLIYYLPPSGNFSNTTTDDGGYFQIPMNLVIGRNPVLLIFPGANGYNRTLLMVTVYGVRVKVPPVFKTEIGRTVRVNGSVEGLDNGTLWVTFGRNRRAVEVRNGTFSALIGPFDSAGEFVAYVWGTEGVLKVIRVAVISPVRLELRTKRLLIGSNETLIVSALDGLGNPISNAPLRIELPGLNETVYTNGKGEVSVYVPNLRPGELNVTVVYPGSTFYLPARASFTVEVVKKGRNPLVYTVPVLAFVLLGVIYYGRRRRFEEETSGTVGVIVPDGVPVLEEGEVELELLCDGELLIDGKPAGRGRKVRVKLGRGEHVVEVRCDGKRFRTVIKVVEDYSEVVRKMYENCFLKWAGRKVRIDGMTPREIELALKSMMFPGEPLETVRRVFEVAEYGRRKLGREEFVAFYRAVERLTGVPCDA